MSARDELAEVIEAGYAGSDSHCPYDHATEIAEAILAAGYVKAEPAWAETLTNDGTYEYTISSDCDGSNVQHWRRVPGLIYEGQASPWLTYTPEES
jgi:hypothetical protein